MPPRAITLFERRRRRTNDLLAKLRGKLAQRWEEQIALTACVYVTGSVGRGEASAQSDLDVFILSGGKPQLPRLDIIELEADLIRANEAVGFPPFSGDGKWLQVYELNDMIGLLGSRDDDGKNVFTARLLLLLESQCLVGKPVYDRAISSIIKEYWRDFRNNRNNFHPVFLMNDIIKYWKVLCLEYEWKNAPRRGGAASSKAERRYNNYKLKHSRLLICYSAIVYLAHCWVRSRGRRSSPSTGTVTQADALEMVSLRPVERLLSLRMTAPQIATPIIDRILEQYAAFLEVTRARKSVLIELFEDSDYRTARRKEASQFGDSVYELIYAICGDLPLFRYLVV